MIIPAISGERRSTVLGTLRFSCKDREESVEHGGHWEGSIWEGSWAVSENNIAIPPGGRLMPLLHDMI